MPCPNLFSTYNFPAIAYNTYVCYFATLVQEQFAEAKSFCNNLYSPLTSLIRIKTDEQRSYVRGFASTYGAPTDLWVIFNNFQ